MSEPQDPESENTLMVPLENREILMFQREEGKGKLGIIAIVSLLCVMVTWLAVYDDSKQPMNAASYMTLLFINYLLRLSSC